MNMLVSVIVVSYDAELYILECLDSIYEQDYDEIELVIADDASVDSTIELIELWVEHHKQRFTNVIVIKSVSNSGVSANCNRGLSASSGLWIKFIAGDDYLCGKGAISKYVEMTKTSTSQILFSDYLERRDNHFSYKKPNSSSLVFAPDFTLLDQKSLVTKFNPFPSPTLFVKKSILEQVGGYDESIPMLEDAPMIVLLSNAGFKFGYVPAPLVIYRRHKSSLVSSYHRNSNNLVHNQLLMYEKYKIPYQKGISRIYFNFLSTLLFRSLQTRSKFLCGVLMHFFRCMLSVYKTIYILYKRIAISLR